jgi:glucose/arabinose dehydrogenase
VNYVRKNPSLETVIARYKVSASNPNVADPASEEILLTYAQPFENHKGGKLAFGNDKYLYIAAGDGGSGGDPNKNGQNKAALLGKILR